MTAARPHARNRAGKRTDAIRRLATAIAVSLVLVAGASGAAEMGGHGGGMGMSHGGGFTHGAPPAHAGGFGTHDGFAHGGADGRFAGHGFHDRRFHDGVAIVPFAYYAPYYYGYPPTAFDTYCNQLSPYYDPQVCWDYYGG